MILVTVSSGHLGEALMRNLRVSGQSALGVDIKPAQWTDRVGSVFDRAFVRNCMSGVTAVIQRPRCTSHTSQLTHARTSSIPILPAHLNLLEEAVAARVGAFVFTSTTSAFGAALTPGLGEPAAWVTEEVVPIPKNIYGVTKLAVPPGFSRSRTTTL